MAHKDNVTMSTLLELDQSGLTKKEPSEDGNNFRNDGQYIEPALVLQQTPRSPYWPFFKFLKTKDNSKTIHCMPCLESYDVKMRKKDICYTGGTSTIKYHMERYHKDLIGASYVNPMNVNSQQI